MCGRLLLLLPLLQHLLHGCQRTCTHLYPLLLLLLRCEDHLA
jgi:hypothetical protein